MAGADRVADELLSLLDRHASEPSRDYCYWRGSVHTYGEIIERSFELAGSLFGNGTEESNEPVSIKLDNPVDALVSIWACIRASVSTFFEEFPRTPRTLPDCGAFLLYTSGTTGAPKWVCCSYEQCFQAIEAMAEHGALDHLEGQVVFVTMPVSHSYGLSTMLECTAAGAAIVFPDGRSHLGPVSELAGDAVQSVVTAIEAVPHLHNQLASLARRLTLKNLAHLGYGAGPMRRSTLEALGARWPSVSFSARYGMTETPSVVAHRVFYAGSLGDERSAGQIITAYNVRIVAANGLPCTPRQEGEIQIGGDCVACYLGEAPPDFLATGDLGFLDDADHLHITGRESTFLKNRGFRVSPEMIEDALAALPGVVDSRALMRDDRLIVEIACSNSRAEVTSIREYLMRKLPPYALPDLIRIVERIPRTASGKTERR